MSTAALPVELDVAYSAADRALALRRDVQDGLTHEPKRLPAKWFYDARGSELFTAITRLPEYYLTRAERSILLAHAAEVAALTRADTVVELGAGTSEKTRILLDAFEETGRLRRFVAFDVSEPTIRESAARLADEYPGIGVTAVVGDFERHLARLPSDGRRVVAFLGSSIGNLAPTERGKFLAALRGTMTRGEWFLLGVDLVKDPARLVAAYDDAAGVTAAFNRNVLAVLNRELDADFDVAAFDHVARYDRWSEWIEMSLRSARAQTVILREVGLAVAFAAGEEVRTEISAKFRPERLADEVLRHGLAVRRFWTDGAGDFGLVLAEAS